jgi:hypothetical protein
MTCLPSSLPSKSTVITLEHALLASLQRHCWYLSEHLVLLTLAEAKVKDFG